MERLVLPLDRALTVLVFEWCCWVLQQARKNVAAWGRISGDVSTLNYFDQQGLGAGEGTASCEVTANDETKQRREGWEKS